MYIWTALYIEDNLEELRDQSIRIGEDLGVKCPLTFLPLHISLKKSFPVADDQVDECVSTLCDYFSKLGPFSIEIEGYELQDGIIWLKVRDNQRLSEIHAHLDGMMLDIFGAKPHELDYSFVFHATLFTDEESKLELAMQSLEKVPLPSHILVRDFLVGLSETGMPGTYSVYKHSHLGQAVSVKEQWEKFKSQ